MKKYLLICDENYLLICDEKIFVNLWWKNICKFVMKNNMLICDEK